MTPVSCMRHSKIRKIYIILNKVRGRIPDSIRSNVDECGDVPGFRDNYRYILLTVFYLLS